MVKEQTALLLFYNALVRFTAYISRMVNISHVKNNAPSVSDILEQKHVYNEVLYWLFPAQHALFLG